MENSGNNRPQPLFFYSVKIAYHQGYFEYLKIEIKGTKSDEEGERFFLSMSKSLNLGMAKVCLDPWD